MKRLVQTTIDKLSDHDTFTRYVFWPLVGVSLGVLALALAVSVAGLLGVPGTAAINPEAFLEAVMTLLICMWSSAALLAVVLERKARRKAAGERA